MTHRLPDDVQDATVEDGRGPHLRRDVARMVDVDVGTTEGHVPPGSLGRSLIQGL